MTVTDVYARTNLTPRRAVCGVRRVSFACRLLIADRRERVLFARYREAGAVGCWRLPGGFVFDGEPMALAATRRLHEQLGILVLPHCIVSVFDDPGDQPGSNRLTITFAASVLSGLAAADPSTGIAEAAWFPRGDFPEDLATEASEALASTGVIGFSGQK